ncbi:MAG: hypothetical protein AAFV85_00080 [Cyanobacteria bacterium J06634_6]
MPNTHSSKPSVKPSKSVIILSAGYGLFFLLMLILAYNGTLPVSALLSKFQYSDKIGHLILYFIPSYLGHRLCQYKHVRKHIPLFPALFTLFTVTEELIQGLSPNRTLDGVDMVCSLLGIAVGYWLAQRQKPVALKS